MTTSVLSFAVPPHRLGHDVSKYMDPDLGPSWPLEPCNVILNDLRPELESKEKAPVMEQLEARGFAIFKHKSETLGTLEKQTDWNASYLEVS